MSTSTQHPPIPRQPIGATFVVAISILGAFAVIQFLAVAAHYYPMIRQQVANAAAQPQRSVLDQSSAPVLPPVPVPDRTTSPSRLSPLDTQRFQKLADKADQDFRVGDFDSSLQAAQEMETLLPGDPSMLLRKARAYEQLGQPADAVAALEETLKIKALPQDVREKTERKIDQLQQLASSAPPNTHSPVQPILRSPDGLEKLDTTGIQPGATLGIVEAQLADGSEGTKHLKVAVKARPGSPVNVQDVKIIVYFYESGDDGEPVLTESKVLSRWLSPPIDWANDEPEILDMQYPTPAADSGKKYYGYVIGVYYNKDLQAFRSEPSKLSADFPLPTYLKEDSN